MQTKTKLLRRAAKPSPVKDIGITKPRSIDMRGLPTVVATLRDFQKYAARQRHVEPRDIVIVAMTTQEYDCIDGLSETSVHVWPRNVTL